MGSEFGAWRARDGVRILHHLMEVFRKKRVSLTWMTMSAQYFWKDGENGHEKNGWYSTVLRWGTFPEARPHGMIKPATSKPWSRSMPRFRPWPSRVLVSKKNPPRRPYQWPFQEISPENVWKYGLIWYSTSILGSLGFLQMDNHRTYCLWKQVSTCPNNSVDFFIGGTSAKHLRQS